MSYISLLKGQCHEIFSGFFTNLLPQPHPSLNHKRNFDFFNNSPRYLQFKVLRRRHCHWWLIYRWTRVDISGIFTAGTVERLDCKRPILWLASSKILTPHPPHRPASVHPPPLVREGSTHSLGGEGDGGSIFWKTPGTALYSTYVSTLWLVPTVTSFPRFTFNVQWHWQQLFHRWWRYCNDAGSKYATSINDPSSQQWQTQKYCFNPILNI